MLNKSFFLCFSMIFFIACSSIPSSLGNIAPGPRNVVKAITDAYFGSNEDIVTQTLVDNIPYASLKLRIGKGPYGLLILESKNNNIYTWVSADGVYLQTYQGRIIAVQGITNNLQDFRSNEPNFMELIDINDTTSFNRYISLDNPEVLDMKLTVKTRFLGLKKVQLLNGERNLNLFEEEISNSYIRWNYVNKYWVDPQDGYVLKSFQQVAPNVPIFEYEITKRPQ
tara:strand:- start:29068 stop:29742 length:675 start_codon:yes stop_codon:yes gene_type:complete